MKPYYTLHPTPYTLTIGWLYPDLMSTYGDRGNIICLVKRCEWRGMKVEIRHLGFDSDHRLLATCDLLFMGGAQDRQQQIVASDLRKNKGPVMKNMIEEGTPALFVCAAYQFMGHYYRPAQGEDISGLGIFDLHTIHPGADKPRYIGNIVVKLNPSLCHPEPFGHSERSEESQGKFREGSRDSSPRAFGAQNDNYLVGFENHGGRTYLGEKVEPLGKVVVGYGNNGEDGSEGAIYKNAFGTYFHGPILPKNPHLADHVIKLALEKKYDKFISLEDLDDSLEIQANRSIVKRLNI